VFFFSVLEESKKLVNKRALKIFRDVISGTLGGIGVTFIGHPFDTIKVRLQTQSSKTLVYNGFFDCTRKTILWEGIPGLYKGVSSPLLGQMFFRATLLSTYHLLQRCLATREDIIKRLKTLDFYIAGAITGGIVTMIESPIDFFKSQMQVQIIRNKTIIDYRMPFANLRQCMVEVYKDIGQEVFRVLIKDSHPHWFEIYQLIACILNCQAHLNNLEKYIENI